jgi:ElaB/YqjD/DUF883 family membrane-anchored ribosome-binding protein
MFEKNQKNENVAVLKTGEHKIADGLHDIAHQAGETARGYYNSASHEVTHASERMKAEIRNNPIRSSAIALGVGALIGLLIRR